MSDTKPNPTPAEVRDTLLNSGRIAGRGFISVRGDDLVTAIEAGPPAKKQREIEDSRRDLAGAADIGTAEHSPNKPTATEERGS